MKKVNVRKRYNGFSQIVVWGAGGITPRYSILCDASFDPSYFNNVYAFRNTSLSKWLRRRDNHVVLAERSDMRQLENLLDTTSGNKTRRITVWNVQRLIYDVGTDLWVTNPAFKHLFPEAVAQDKIRKSLLKKNKYHSKPLPLP